MESFYADYGMDYYQFGDCSFEFIILFAKCEAFMKKGLTVSFI